MLLDVPHTFLGPRIGGRNTGEGGGDEQQDIPYMPDEFPRSSEGRFTHLTLVWSNTCVDVHMVL